MLYRTTPIFLCSHLECFARASGRGRIRRIPKVLTLVPAWIFHRLIMMGEGVATQPSSTEDIPARQVQQIVKVHVDIHGRCNP